MKPPSILFAALLLSAGISTAQPTPDYGQAATILIWDNTSAPHDNGIRTPETEYEPNRIGNTSEAVLYLFPADKSRATGQAVVICPGGGYARLSMDKEGYLMARWFAENGITAAVLKYRMPNGHPEVPLEDAEQAVRILSGKAPGAEGFTARQVGIAGCSAGGHLAAMTATMAATRPAFAILFYPVITGERGKCHKGSFDRLLGEGRTDSLTARYSLENRVDSLTPPTLLLLSDDDRAVPPVSSTRFYDALKEHGIAASMHIYPAGGHGWGMREDITCRDAWRAAVLEWLQRVNDAR